MTTITVDLDPTGGRAALAELAARQELVDAEHRRRCAR